MPDHLLTKTSRRVRIWILLLLFLAAQGTASAQSARPYPAESVVRVETTLQDGKGGQGSGVIVRQDGLVLTALHVVEGAQAIRITLRNGEAHAVRGVAHLDRDNDLVLLKIEASGLASMRLGDVNGTKKGSAVYAATYPHGSWDEASGTFRRVVDFLPGVQALEYLCPISPGSSGGPLLDSRGALIGIITFAQGDGKGLNYAAPASLIRPFLDQHQEAPLSSLRRKEPVTATGWYKRFIVLKNDGDVEGALVAINRALATSPRFTLAYLNRSVLNRKLRRLDKVLEDCTKVIELDPDQPAGFTYRAVAYKELGKYEDAIEDFDRAIELAPDYVHPRVGRALAYFEMSRWDRALADADWAIQRGWSHESMFYVRGGASVNLGDYDQGIADLTRYIESDPALAVAFEYRGMAWSKKKDYGRARDDFTRSLELAPASARVLTRRGLVFTQLYEYQAAVEDLSRAIGLDPEDGEAYWARGLGYFGLDKYEESLSDLHKAQELRPDLKERVDSLVSDVQRAWAKVHRKRGNAEQEAGNSKTALEELTEAIRIDPTYARAYYDRAWVHEDMGDLVKAEEDFGRALENDPDLSGAYRERAALRLMSGQFKSVIQDASKAIELDPKDSSSFFYRGVARAETQDLDGALTDLNQAIQLDPGFGRPYLARAYILLRREKYDAAVGDFEKAIELLPESREAIEPLLNDAKQKAQ